MSRHWRPATVRLEKKPLDVPIGPDRNGKPRSVTLTALEFSQILSDLL